MANVVKSLKLAWLKGMEALGTSASKLASNAKVKVQEMNLEARRREIFTAFGVAALDLWQNGESLPAPLDAMLKEVKELDEKLGVLRAQRIASVNAAKEEAPVQTESEQEADQPEETQEAENIPEVESVPEVGEVDNQDGSGDPDVG